MSATPPTIRTARPSPDAMNWPNQLAANQLGLLLYWIVISISRWIGWSDAPMRTRSTPKDGSGARNDTSGLLEGRFPIA